MVKGHFLPLVNLCLRKIELNSNNNYLFMICTFLNNSKYINPLDQKLLIIKKNCELYAINFSCKCST